jgi:hypothetical protein
LLLYFFLVTLFFSCYFIFFGFLSCSVSGSGCGIGSGEGTGSGSGSGIGSGWKDVSLFSFGKMSPPLSESEFQKSFLNICF